MEKVRISRHFDNNGDFYLSFNHFLEYCQSMYDNIIYIKKYYHDDFNKQSSQNIETLKAYFELCIKAFYNVCYENKNNSENTAVQKLSLENQTFYYIQKLNNALTNRIDFYARNKINAKYYKKIELITNRIFELEEKMSKITNNFWANILAKSIDDIKDGKFACLAKVLIDWRTENSSQKLSKYMNARYAMSVSFITNYKSRFFGERNETAHRIGILYYTDKIIAGLHTDAYLEEFIAGKCPLKKYHTYSNIQKTNIIGEHEIYSLACKIATPKSVLFFDNDGHHGTSYNEVIIDKRTAKPFAVFCIRKVNEHLVENYEQALLTAKKMAEKFNLPLIELDSKNEFENENEYFLHLENL